MEEFKILGPSAHGDAIVSVQERTLKIYKGSYENFVATREAERQKLESAYRQQQVEI